MKECVASYCECIERHEVRYVDVLECFAGFYIGRRATELPVARRFRSILNLALELGELRGARFEFDAKKFYAQKFWELSNMDFDTFSALVTLVGLDVGPYETKKHLIDDALVRARHSIVHGKRHEVGPERFDSLLKGILELCVQMRDDVQSAAEMRKFLIAV